MSKVYADFLEITKEIRTLNHIEHILGWDQNVMMPPGAIRAREPQLTLMSTITHKRLTSDHLGGLLTELRKTEVLEGLSPEQRANVREMGRDHDKAKAVPEEFVKEMSKTATLAFDEWVKAKKDSDLQTKAEWRRNWTQCFLAEMDRLAKKAGLVR